MPTRRRDRGVNGVVVYNAILKAHYVSLWDTCKIHPEKLPIADSILAEMLANKPIYVRTGQPLGIPWLFIACIHSLECALSFGKHLHNGDHLTARTVHVPKGRPILSMPPFSWQFSATDALKLKGLDRWTDWSIEGWLYQLEGYNGYGYLRYHPTVNSPYLWAGSNLYDKGKYVADGQFDPNAVSQQLGIGCLLKRAEEKNVIVFTI
jgi:lysozyme family protein